MFKYIIADKNGVPVDTHPGLDDHITLMTETHRILDAHWETAAITTATTTTVISAKPNQSILLTDIIIVLSKKVNAATIIPRFHDGTNTINMFTLEAATAAFQFSHAFQGGLRGWEDADFQVVTNQATTVSVFAGYVHVSPKNTKSYNVWNADR